MPTSIFGFQSEHYQPFSHLAWAHVRLKTDDDDPVCEWSQFFHAFFASLAHSSSSCRGNPAKLFSPQLLSLVTFLRTT